MVKPCDQWIFFSLTEDRIIFKEFLISRAKPTKLILELASISSIELPLFYLNYLLPPYCTFLRNYGLSYFAFAGFCESVFSRLHH